VIETIYRIILKQIPGAIFRIKVMWDKIIQEAILMPLLYNLPMLRLGL